MRLLDIAVLHILLGKDRICTPRSAEGVKYAIHDMYRYMSDEYGVEEIEYSADQAMLKERED